MKNAKYMTPSAATPSQSRPRGHLIRSANAIGNSRNPTPNRNTPSVTGSLMPIANRVVPPAMPPSALDAIAASTPTYSFREGRMEVRRDGLRSPVNRATSSASPPGISHEAFTRYRAEKLAKKAAIAKATRKDLPYVKPHNIEAISYASSNGTPITLEQLMAFADSAIDAAIASVNPSHADL